MPCKYRYLAGILYGLSFALLPVETGNFCGQIPVLHSNGHSVLALPPRRSRDGMAVSLGQLEIKPHGDSTC